MMTVAQVLRALRPYLPTGFEKYTEKRYSVGYVYKDRLLIEVFGVCQWNATTKEREGCHATKIKVTPLGHYRGTRFQPGLRTTTHSARKDGTFKLESVGSRVQFCRAAMIDIDQSRAAHEVKRIQMEADTKSLSNKLFNIAKLEGLKPSQQYSSTIAFGEREDVDKENFQGTIQNGPALVSMDLKYITFPQAKQLLRLMRSF